MDIRILPSLTKAQALHGDLDIASLYQLPSQMNGWVERLRTTRERYEALHDFGMVILSEPGNFEAEEGNYDTAIANLMTKLVVPTSLKRKPVGEVRLATEVRSIFRREKLLGEEVADINNHLIVSHFPVAEEKELFVDFAIKNGGYHLTETIDFRVKTGISGPKHKEAGLVAFTLYEARERLGPNVRRFVVYASSTDAETKIAPHLAMVGSVADQVLNFESEGDREFYLNEMRSAVHRRRPENLAQLDPSG